MDKILLWSPLSHGAMVARDSSVGSPPLLSPLSPMCTLLTCWASGLQLWGRLCGLASVKAMSKPRGVPPCPNPELKPFLLPYKC